MNPSIEKALKKLQNAKYDGYFEAMDEVVPDSLKPVYQDHKGKFMSGNYPHNFYQMLTTFAKQVNKELESPTPEEEHTILNPTPTPSTEKQTILFLAANPNDSAVLQNDKEFRIISERLRRNQHYDLLRPEFAVTIENLLIAMNQQPNIVHFSGHGKQEGIMISNHQNTSQLMPTRALSRLFRQHRESVKLVLLNSCYSEEQAKVVSELDIYVIGMNDEIGESAAIDFASGIYIGLSEGKDFQKCFDDAMILLETKHDYATDLPQVWKGGEKLDW
ncbi:MAG: CHAT domain-containing protein [Flammeovirgaceae bacterium]